MYAAVGMHTYYIVHSYSVKIVPVVKMQVCLLPYILDTSLVAFELCTRAAHGLYLYFLEVDKLCRNSLTMA
jgi:hypothetical protein